MICCFMTAKSEESGCIRRVMEFGCVLYVAMVAITISLNCFEQILSPLAGEGYLLYSPQL